MNFLTLIRLICKVKELDYDCFAFLWFSGPVPDRVGALPDRVGALPDRVGALPSSGCQSLQANHPPGYRITPLPYLPLIGFCVDLSCHGDEYGSRSESQSLSWVFLRYLDNHLLTWWPEGITPLP